MDTTHILTPEQLRSKDFYARLEVTRDATDAEIKAAYERVRKRYMDFIEQYPEYSECYVLIEEAYRKLKDPEFRQSLLVAEREMEAQKRKAKLRSLIMKVLPFAVANALLFAAIYNADPGGMPVKVGIGCAIIGFIAIVVLSRKGKTEHTLFALLLTASLCANAAIGYRFFQKQQLFLDNQNAFEVVIKANGEPLDTVYSFGFVKRAIRPGTWTFETYKMPGDSLVETFEVTVKAGERSLYNVLSSGSYTTGTESYSDRPYFEYLSGLNVPKYPEFTRSERWIELDYDYVFQSPPGEIMMQKGFFGDGSATRTYILRNAENNVSY